MKKLLLILVAMVTASAAQPCTSALIGADRTISGNPILWKHRDSGFEQNFIERVEATDTTMAYIALFNGGDSLLREAWIGVNERSFAIMNTASYNLAPDTATLKDREGLIMSEALRKCETVNDFARLLDSLPKPLGVQANFGVIDADGNGAVFETDDHGYKCESLRADSMIIRTNFSCTGTCGDGLGRVRYDNACHLLCSRTDISPRLLTDSISRSFYYAPLGCDIIEDSEVTEIEDRGDFIPRRSTSASIAIELGEQPTLYVILGYPPLSTATTVTLNNIPKEMRPILPGALSPLSKRNVERRNALFRRVNGKYLLNIAKLR